MYVYILAHPCVGAGAQDAAPESGGAFQVCAVYIYIDIYL